jgi:hypothetical protein
MKTSPTFALFQSLATIALASGAAPAGADEIPGPRPLLSVPPRPGCLHRTSELDTLGPDREGTQCRF